MIFLVLSLLGVLNKKIISLKKIIPMKLRILSLALVMTSLISCSSDDTSINDTNNSNYFPLTTGNE